MVENYMKDLKESVSHSAVLHAKPDKNTFYKYYILVVFILILACKILYTY